MVKVVLANTRANRTALNAAVTAAGLKCVFRMFSGADLLELKAPVVLAFEPANTFKLTPDFLQYLRRTHPGGVRYSPAIVFCDDKAEINDWRFAGAVVLPCDANEKEMSAALDHALKSMEHWVDSSTFVGPERRTRNAIFKLKRRRRIDGQHADAADVPDESVPVSSLDRLHRRISLSAQLLQGSAFEARRAFRDLIKELEVSANAHGRADLAGVVQRLSAEADRLLKNGSSGTDALEIAVAQLGQRI